MTIWLVSDTHFGHANILTFTTPTGELIRPGFASVEEMDERMITEWNAVVRPSDHIYHLGDVAMKQQPFNAIMPRLAGKKRLLRGNHDIFHTKIYARYFEEIGASRVFDGLILTHIPIHPESLGRFTANVHGHIHERPSYGKRYLNVSVERTEYRPVSLEEVRAAVKMQQEAE